MTARDVIGDLTPTDLLILEHLIEHHAANAAQLASALHYTRPALTRHIDRLQGAGLIAIDRTAPTRYGARMYCANPDALHELARWLKRFAWNATSKRAELRARLRVPV